jgi:cyclohexyl-isocyanide hydratase
MTNPIRLVSLVFPNVTQLDLTGPVQLFSRLPGVTIDLAWRRIEPVPTDAGFSILPTTTFDTAPQADVLMVPGGEGAFELLADPAALEFVRRQAVSARFVTSVCTGAFVLGAVGLLRGRRATTHWASHDLLPLVGAIPEHARVVIDGNVVTGGGVTSGIDFALELAAQLLGPQAARRVQLTMEYDPQPPWDAGSPAGSDADPLQVAEARAHAEATRGPRVRAAMGRLASYDS